MALDETVKPALGTAASQAQDLAQAAAQRSASTLGTIREEGPGRAQAMLHTAVEAAGHLAHTMQERAGHLAEDAGQKTKKHRRQAGRALKSTGKDLGQSLQGAKETGLGVLAGVQEGVQHLFHDAGDDVAAGRRQAQRRLAQARQEAEQELRRSGRKWKEAKLERAVNKRIAPLHKQTRRELARLDKEAMKQYKASSGHGGVGSTLTSVALVGTGIAVLARVPSVRQSILRAVESVNPEVAESLKRASRNARDVIGSAWLDSIEENKQTPAPGAAAATQAGTTGGTWGASVEPGSPPRHARRLNRRRRRQSTGRRLKAAVTRSDLEQITPTKWVRILERAIRPAFLRVFLQSLQSTPDSPEAATKITRCRTWSRRRVARSHGKAKHRYSINFPVLGRAVLPMPIRGSQLNTARPKTASHLSFVQTNRTNGFKTLSPDM
ncbi:hypothetical protein ACFSC4_04495 [Deinococcus malanensis]|uniref:hypothetical protein n=1 Tax=Deinococcus malanensis TaxID=1706855 RepID=UPI0036348A4C